MIRIRTPGTRTPNQRPQGFSLLEVLIAVVVLATGLLALAALQGSLSRASAEAKVRGRVAAMLSARMDEVRGDGYGSAAVGATTVTTTTGDCDPASPDATDWIDCTRAHAGLSSLTSTRTVQAWSGTASFALAAPANPQVPQFKRITLTATWADATGGNHQLGMTSDLSSMALTNNLLLPPKDQGLGGGGPVVRTIDPATAGVIPIALGTDATSATSNPVPELVGQKNNQQIVGTKFVVLNYTPPANGAVVIRKRFENEVMKCSCQYGAGGSNLPEIYRTAQWPAIWNGERYDVHAPSPATAAPGQTFAAGPRSGVVQSPLCQECCRDHHDTSASGEVKFDPERSGGVTKFQQDDAGVLVAVTDTSAGTYLAACRVIRVDGFWRTASDMYARQYGLLETQPLGGVAAKSGLPTDSAAAAYTGFAKGFLALYDGASGNPPGDAQGRFDGTSGIDAAVITIEQPSSSDYRYLHGRGLYVDHLEEKALTRLTDMLDPDNPQGCAGEADCGLPFLPFTTVNLTEIAKWEEVDNTGILTINSGNLLATDPAEPSGGRTIGEGVGTAGNQTSMRRSNSGIAVNAVLATVAGIDPGDDSEVLSDVQPFEVTGVSAGPAFDVRVGGAGSNPFVFFTLDNDSDRECLKPAGGDHHCVTVSGTVLPQSGSVRIANYWIETTTSQQLTATCAGATAVATVDVPTFQNFEVASATIDGVSGSIAASTNDNKAAESTSVTFSAIPADGLVLVTLTEQTGSPTFATIASCTTNAAGDEINDIVWIEPWMAP